MTTFELTPNGDRAVRTDRFAQATRVLCVLLFFSGFPPLIYQLTWQRALSRIFGVNIGSATMLVAALMLGLGLGGLAGGWLSKRRGVPLLPLLAAIELMSGAFGLMSLQIVDSIGALTVGLPLTVTAAATLTLVTVPALLMGATVPLLVGHLVRRCGHVGSAAGLLYCLNILGAGAACLAGLVFLFPFVGMQGSVYAAAAINAAVASGALVAHWRGRHRAIFAGGEAPAALVARKPMLGLVPLLSLSAAGGLVALSYEIFFFRTVSYVTGSPSTALATSLSAFLVGLASGSRQAGHNCTALTRDGVMRRAVGTLMKANLFGLLFLPLLDHLAGLGRGVIGVAILMVFLVARSWGALLPYLAELGVAGEREAGMRTGVLYFANSLGAAAGAIVTSFVLIDRLGLLVTGAVLVGAGLACAVLLVSAVQMPRSEKILRAGLAAALGLIAFVAIPRPSAGVLERLQGTGVPVAEPLIQAVEDRSR
jgi:predicted membrane-bound spermidine synthase